MRTFGVSKNSVKRSVKKYREEGIEAFYQPRQGRGATVMTEDVTARAQELLSRGCSRREVADELGVPYDTLRNWDTCSRVGKKWRCSLTTAAAVDRLVHHSVILELNLRSYRMEKAHKKRRRGRK